MISKWSSVTAPGPQICLWILSDPSRETAGSGRKLFSVRSAGMTKVPTENSYSEALWHLITSCQNLMPRIWSKFFESDKTSSVGSLQERRWTPWNRFTMTRFHTIKNKIVHQWLEKAKRHRWSIWPDEYSMCSSILCIHMFSSFHTWACI